MRTKTTKEAEVIAFEKLTTISILIGATKVLYKRHETGFWELFAGIGWALFVLRFWGII